MREVGAFCRTVHPARWLLHRTYVRLFGNGRVLLALFRRVAFCGFVLDVNPTAAEPRLRKWIAFLCNAPQPAHALRLVLLNEMTFKKHDPKLCLGVRVSPFSAFPEQLQNV